jgi:hypothetical protein
MPHGICSHISSLSLIKYLKHRISCTSVHTKDTHFTQQVGDVNKHFRLHRIKCVLWCVFVCVCLCLCVCSNEWTLKYCARTEAEGDIWYEDRGSSRRMNETAQWEAAKFVLVIEWWTERQWDRWDKRNALEKLKIHIKFQFEAVKGISNLGSTT